ncbi:unnamed protein product [Periconia digitata]|uniref:Xylulose kinase n=1 Tax=Periconia digitata TaxID=1303443 RepID=A0A9W4XTF0_9PLEO|nr:unnamed protein product [Periconia digitata]
MADQFLGFDLSTQQLKGIVIKSDLRLVHEAKVDFDADFPKYGIHKGVLTNPSAGEVFAPVAIWLEAIDLVLQRLKEQGADLSKIRGISGAGMQHGTVFWSHDAETLLAGLDGRKSLVEQLSGAANGGQKSAFSHPNSPNWQDASTQNQCERFDAALGSPEKLAQSTGSKAHHRFSGPQILRFREKFPEDYEATSRISLVSSFFASVFLGKVAPIDKGDVCGTNLWDINTGRWHDDLLKLTAGGSDIDGLRTMLGDVYEDGGKSFGSISPYFVKRYGFSSSAQIVTFTGDNPSTILALPLRSSDAIVSLGTSTTFLMSTTRYMPDPAYHFMNHPTTSGLYMFMLCYKNGGLAREHIRDAINSLTPSATPNSWDLFNSTATSTPVLGQENPKSDPQRLGLFFPRPEIVPNVKAGTWRFLYKNDRLSAVNSANDNSSADWPIPKADARAILESQFLSLRLRSQNLVEPQGALPPQPRRIYMVGGGAANSAIAELAGQVLGGSEGVYKLDIGGNACALGAAYKAAWGVQRENDENFEDFLEKRWNEEGFVKKICEGYRKGVFERYGDALKGFAEMEHKAFEEMGEGKLMDQNAGGKVT